MTVVIGTAGHIDHGKTTLLRALTGIDADRLPEERRRGMTIDVGYAHMALPDGTEIDFVDVPGHDRLVGNMLVGAGEIDAALVVVAADDGLRAQTHEHLDLLGALGVHHALIAITKCDVVPDERLTEVAAAIDDRLGGTGLEGAPVIPVSAVSGAGVEGVRAALVALRDQVFADSGRRRLASRPPRLAIDRVFTVKGRGTVVTGTLRGGRLARGDALRLVPGDGTIRVREVQVHGAEVDAVADGGRTALNVTGAAAHALRRGAVLTADPGVVATERLLVRLDTTVVDRARFRFHLGTDAVEATIGRSGRDEIALGNRAVAAVLRLDGPVAVARGDRFVLRRSSAPSVVGGTVLDPLPTRGVSRRRQTPDRVTVLADAVLTGDEARVVLALTDLHGLDPDGTRPAADVRDLARAAAIASVTAGTGASLTAVRAAVARAVRRQVTVRPADAASLAGTIVDELVAEGLLDRDGDRVRRPGETAAAPDQALLEAMARLERALDNATPPPLAEAARLAGCSAAGIRELERSGRIVVLDRDLAYAMSAYRDLAATALTLATKAPLTPAGFRDASGTSRRYVMPILEDLDRRGILRRTPAGHLPGPRAPAAARVDA